MYKKILYLLIVIIGFAIYLSTLKAVPGNIDSKSSILDPPFSGNILPMELSHERSSYATLLALDELGTTQLSVRLANAAAPDTGFYQGKLFSYFPPGVAYMGLPLYELGKHFGLSQAFAYFSESLVAILALCLLFKICLEIFKFPTWISFFVVILTGFASTFLNFSITFYQHIPTVFLLLLSFYSVWRFRQGSRFSWVWASIVWGCYGLSSFFDYPNLILFLPILVYFLFSAVDFSSDKEKVRFKISKTFILTSIVLISLGGLHMYYNYKNFGSIKRFSNSLATYDPTKPTETYDALSQENTKQIAENKETISSNLNEDKFFHGIRILLFQFDKSLIMHAPFYLLALWAILLLLLRKKITPEYATIIALICTNIFIYASFGDPWGGWAFGPRYLVPSIPLFAILFGYWLSLPRAQILKRILALEFFFYGAGVALIGGLGRGITVPIVESIGLDVPRTYMADIAYIKQGGNGSFLYNNYINHKITLGEFYFILLGSLTLLAIITLFILPFLEKKYGNQNK